MYSWIRPPRTSRLITDAGAFKLADGDIILKGLDPQGEGASEFAVLGGTGTYGTATGEATLTDTESANTDIVIRLAS